VTWAARAEFGEYMIATREDMVMVAFNRVTAIAATALAVLVVSCSSSSATLGVSDGALALGTWGGDSSGLIVSDTAMHLHIACTYGDVSGRIPVAANGQFDVAGSYMLRAYPIAIGPSVPARFVGHLDGASLTVTVIVNDTVQHQTVTRGPVVVTYGEAPRLGPCPICRRPIVTQRWPWLRRAHAAAHR
jgi:hypothetical protein